MRRFVLFALLLITAPAAAAGLDDLAFLQDHWEAEAFGGVIEEIWLPAHGDVMHGVFRAVSDGALSFAEFIQVTVEGDTTWSCASRTTAPTTRPGKAMAPSWSSAWSNRAK